MCAFGFKKDLKDEIIAMTFNLSMKISKNCTLFSTTNFSIEKLWTKEWKKDGKRKRANWTVSGTDDKDTTGYIMNKVT